MTTDERLYPLLLDRKTVEPIWGGTRLAEWLNLPEPHPESLGETWQVYDTNPVRNGPLAGQTLEDLTRSYGEALIGTRTMARYSADFPLLAKFIDADKKLSIQVHPNDDYAHTNEAETGFHGKTEAWYILAATPDADITYGLKRLSNREEFAAAVHNEELEELLERIPVRAGDVVFVPAGTLHAINAGIMLFEIQQKSDLTYRVYDYGRPDAKTGKQRPLHLDKALDVAEFAPARYTKIAPLPLDNDGNRVLLIACPYFALERWTLAEEQSLNTDPGTFEILTAIEGQGSVVWSDGEVPLKRGESVVLPASLGTYTLRNTDSEKMLQVLRAYVPEIDRDLVEPLRDLGTDDERIFATVVPEVE